MKVIGRDASDCGGETPLGHFFKATGSSTSLRSAQNAKQWILVHLNELEESDFDLLARSAPKFSVVHCPRSHRYFGHSRFQFERLRELGFNICLGTDSLASNGDLNLFGEMREFQKSFGDVSPEETLAMATINPARALKEENRLGKIHRGAPADLVAIPSRGGQVFEEIIAFEGEPWQMIAGKTAET
jgi:cytosine/adenosine deaminase-related metal-dependent hydrolase